MFTPDLRALLLATRYRIHPSLTDWRAEYFNAATAVSKLVTCEHCPHCLSNVGAEVSALLELEDQLLDGVLARRVSDGLRVLNRLTVTGFTQYLDDVDNHGFSATVTDIGTGRSVTVHRVTGSATVLSAFDMLHPSGLPFGLFADEDQLAVSAVAHTYWA